jgi:hypothetical protein
MAEATRMTTADVVASVMAGEHGDFVREAVALVARELMEAEISVEVGAELGEVSAERSSHRNGYRPRPWETRVGEIELLIPRKHQGPAYFPSFLEPRRRSEQAIVSVVLEAWPALWSFATHDEVTPTNNLAERGLRSAVIYRKLPLGSQSESGERRIERLLSAHTTCRLQRRSLFAYLTDALTAHAHGHPAPLLTYTATPLNAYWLWGACDLFVIA